MIPVESFYDHVRCYWSGDISDMPDMRTYVEEERAIHPKKQLMQLNIRPMKDGYLWIKSHWVYGAVYVREVKRK